MVVKALRRWIALSEGAGTHTEVYATLGAYNGGWAITVPSSTGLKAPQLHKARVRDA